ncbi:hypothetical protein BV898_17505 [Hypsibius exemplaris]|uniref:Uncharacterized protein n=1 Tax=Hypsibius exemplaris TaxID=2072580 RepID=A0A9X6NF73_HYPEX|nr:hypothetical protein BV898_17505 [Hypsibius exemplaris]
MNIQNRAAGWCVQWKLRTIQLDINKDAVEVRGLQPVDVRHLQYVASVYNTSVYNTFQLSQFKMPFGRNPTLPGGLALSTATYPFIEDVKIRMVYVYAEAAALMETKHNPTYAGDYHPDEQ